MKKSEQIAPFVLQKKSVAAAPMMISSPHSGTFYPDRLFQISSLTRRDFQKVEDAAVDSLFRLRRLWEFLCCLELTGAFGSI